MHKFAIAGAIAAALLGTPVLAQEAQIRPPVASAPGAHDATETWWTALNDPVLSALIGQGLDANLDIVQAQARIRHSRALLAGVRAAFGPSGSAGLQGRAA